MTISIDYGNTNIITVEQSDCTLVSGTLYKIDTNTLRLALKDIEDSETGVAFPRTNQHNTEVTVAGITYFRTIGILAPYSIQFLPDSAWSVRLEGSNNNFWDIEAGILVQNQVQVIPTNSAGAQTVAIGSGVTAQDKTDITTGVWAALAASNQDAGSTGELLQTILSSTGLSAGEVLMLTEMYARLDLDRNNPSTYTNDGSNIVNSKFGSLTKTDTGIVSIVQRS